MSDIFYYYKHNTPIGELCLISDDKAILACEHGHNAKYLGNLHLTNEIKPLKSDIIKNAVEELEQYFSGARKSFSVTLKLSGTPFQVKVWRALQEIDYGSTISYKDLAYRIGDINSSQAVGNANSKNSFLIFVPCHRVINSNRGIGGFNAGIKVKKWLLDFENANL